MDDRYFFGALIYLIIVITTIGFMPDSFFLGETTDLDVSAVSGAVPENPINPLSTLNFFQKLSAFMLFTVVIEGIPVYFAVFLLVINIGTVIITAVWIFDKARGIGS